MVTFYIIHPCSKHNLPLYNRYFSICCFKPGRYFQMCNKVQSNTSFSCVSQHMIPNVPGNLWKRHEKDSILVPNFGSFYGEQPPISKNIQYRHVAIATISKVKIASGNQQGTSHFVQIIYFLCQGSIEHICLLKLVLKEYDFLHLSHLYGVSRV